MSPDEVFKKISSRILPFMIITIFEIMLVHWIYPEVETKDVIFIILMISLIVVFLINTSTSKMIFKKMKIIIINTLNKLKNISDFKIKRK